MCGIAGIFSPQGSSRSPLQLDRIAQSIRHRGPDGVQTFQSADHSYQAVFVRLSIIDHATGGQPIESVDKRFVLTGNGEIYNYLELRQENAAYPYVTSGDMEAIMPLVAKYQDNFVDHLNGMFGLALYDQTEKRLLLARDRLGIKPVYWCRLADGRILFGSEIKAILATGLVKPEVNESVIPDYLGHGYIPAPNTLFKGIQKLAPGHILTVDHKGNLDVRAYWKPSPLPAAQDKRPVSEIAHHLSELMRDSVKLQLRSDVPLGVLLSGGLDSGIILALAAQESTKPLTAYTARFEGGTHDETPLASKIANQYGVTHEILDIPHGSITAELPRMAYFLEEPLNDAALLPNYLIEQALGKNLTVALNGTGGDELFAGYRRYFQLPVEQKYLTLPSWVRQTIIEPGLKKMNPTLAWKLARAEKFHTDRGAYLFDHNCHFPAPVLALIDSPFSSPDPVQKSFFRDSFARDSQTSSLIAELQSYLPEDLLLLLDRTSMSVSVEGRVPLLDHRLVEAALAVPQAIRTPGLKQKALMRQIAGPLLPNDIITAPKRGFASPVPDWVSGDFGRQAQRLLTSQNALERGWWSRRGIERLFARPREHAFRIYSLAVLEVMIRLHMESPDPQKSANMPLEAFADGI